MKNIYKLRSINFIVTIERWIYGISLDHKYIEETRILANDHGVIDEYNELGLVNPVCGYYNE